MTKDQMRKALEYHIKKEKDCHPNLPLVNKHHLKRIGELSKALNELGE